MSGIEIGLASLAALLILIYAGLHVSIALALVSFFGIWALRDNPDHAARILSLAARESISSYLFRRGAPFRADGGSWSAGRISGVTPSTSPTACSIACAAVWAWRRWGRISVFAAITGISIASAAVFAKVAVPEMVRIGYTRRFAAGVVAGSSILGMMIPPEPAADPVRDHRRAISRTAVHRRNHARPAPRLRLLCRDLSDGPLHAGFYRCAGSAGGAQDQPAGDDPAIQASSWSRSCCSWVSFSAGSMAGSSRRRRPAPSGRSAPS